jgi:pimeloyl-ACP methyl ester carboxylesterase
VIQDTPHTVQSSVTANAVEIVYDAFGEASAPPILLVMDLGRPMIAWDDDFCALLAARGYRVLRFDNRDAGFSSHFEEAGIPDIPVLINGIGQREAAQVAYTLRDMADDAVGLLGALGTASAHVVGLAMGGMIAQLMTIHNPDRVRTLTSIMSTTGDPSLPFPRPEALALLLATPPRDRAGYVNHAIQVARLLSGPKYPVDEDHVRKRETQVFDRGLNPAGTARQLAALIASGSLRQALASVTVPTLVIHGNADPLYPIECGVATAQAIPGAKIRIIEGLGHYLPPAAWPQVIDAIKRHAV